jgi:hypothetical protein
LTLDQPFTLLTLFVLSILFLLPMIPGQEAARRLERRLVGFTQRPALAIFTLFLAVIAIRFVLLLRFPVPVPYIHDEFSYLLMGDTFAHGRLANPTHPLWLSFETMHVNWIPKYASVYPPAQGFVLAVGQLLGNPWIGVLLSNAAMCAAILWMLRAWFPARWAFLGAVLAAAKFGFVHYWINSYWGGATAATGGALVLGALARILRRASLRDALLLGLGVAILANSRPYEGLLFCAPAGCVFLWWLRGRAKKSCDPAARFKTVFLPLATLLIFTGAFMALYNWKLTGNPLLFPHVLSMRTYHTESFFLWEQPRPPLHYNNPEFERFFNGLLRKEYTPSWQNAWRVWSLKFSLMARNYLWPGALILVPFVPLLLFDKKKRLLVVTLVLVIGGSLPLVWSNPHYIAPITCVFFALVIQAMRRLQVLVGRRRRYGMALSRVVVVLLLVETVSNVERDICNPLRPSCQGDPDRLAISKRLESTEGRHLVVVRYNAHHNVLDEWVYNGAEIDTAKVLWARDMDAAQNEKLLAYFKDRQIWLVQPDEREKEARQLKPYPGAAIQPLP